MHEYEGVGQALQDLPESTCTTPLEPSMVATGFATDHPRKSQNSATDAATSIGFTAPVPSWRHPTSPNGGTEPLAGMAIHSRNYFLLVDSCAGICPKIVIGPSAIKLVLPHDPTTSKTIKPPANTIAELEEGQTISSALNGTTATNSAPVFWVGPSKAVSSSADLARKPGQRVTTMSSKTGKESSDCDAGGAGGCLGTVSSSIHPLRCTKDTLGVHVVVNQTIGDIIRNVCLDCLNCDTRH